MGILDAADSLLGAVAAVELARRALDDALGEYREADHRLITAVRARPGIPSRPIEEDEVVRLVVRGVLVEGRAAGNTWEWSTEVVEVVGLADA
jgi:hypothetical protein